VYIFVLHNVPKNRLHEMISRRYSPGRFTDWRKFENWY